MSNLAALTSPVKLPVISPVTSPTKLLAVIIPLVLTEELLSNVVAVSAFPVTSPVIFPITFPVKGPTNWAAVIIPVVLILPSVPTPDALAPTNFPLDDWYWRTLPFTFAVSLSTSSKNSRRTSPPPPCSWTICFNTFSSFLNKEISDSVVFSFIISFPVFSLMVSKILIAWSAVVSSSTFLTTGFSSFTISVSYTHLRAHET